jgi:hypothetical protein
MAQNWAGINPVVDKVDGAAELLRLSRGESPVSAVHAPVFGSDAGMVVDHRTGHPAQSAFGHQPAPGKKDEAWPQVRDGLNERFRIHGWNRHDLLPPRRLDLEALPTDLALDAGSECAFSEADNGHRCQLAYRVQPAQLPGPSPDKTPFAFGLLGDQHESVAEAIRQRICDDPRMMPPGGHETYGRWFVHKAKLAGIGCAKTKWSAFVVSDNRLFRRFRRPVRAYRAN